MPLFQCCGYLKFLNKIKFTRHTSLAFGLFTAELQKGIFFYVSRIQYVSSLKLSHGNMRSIKASILVSEKAIRILRVKSGPRKSHRNRDIHN